MSQTNHRGHPPEQHAPNMKWQSVCLLNPGIERVKVGLIGGCLCVWDNV